MRSLAITAALTLSALALPAAAQADLKLGYVDLQRALNEVEEGKVAKSALKREFDQKQKLLDDKQEELKRLKADFDKQAVVMAEDARRDRQNELDRKLMEVQGLFMQLQKELSERERDATRGIFDKMNAIIREIAEADGFTMVFERGDAGLMYAPPSLDLTNELIRKYNARHKGTAAAAAAPTAEKKDAGGKKADAGKKPSGK
jgi:outer membrane protein